MLLNHFYIHNAFVDRSKNKHISEMEIKHASTRVIEYKDKENQVSGLE